MRLIRSKINLHRARLPLAIAAATLMINGCTWLAGPEEEVIGATLADLQPARMPNLTQTVPSVSLEEIEESYQLALEVASDDEVRRKILIRLAGLQMMRSEQEQLDATEAGQFFTDTISMYEELVRLQEGRPGSDKLIYQLAKAYALDGRTDESAQALNRLAAEFPDSPYIGEAQFRRAERAFSEGDYASAEEYYRSVRNADEDSAYRDNAIYMLGWSQFKRNRYDESLASFTEVLDGIMQGEENFKNIDAPQKNLAEDTLRVMSLIFSYLDGAKSISETYEMAGVRSYNHLLYQALGDLYLEKKRYVDSADTFSHFVSNHPSSDYAPEFSVRIITVYDEGDFPAQLLPAKEDFINNYGISSNYWQQKPIAVQDSLSPYLHEYLEELAKYEHSLAQSLRDPEGEDLDSAQIAKMQSESSGHYEKAARWYEEFVETFPNDEKTPGMVFLLGESFYESNQLAKAITAYEKVAYEYLDGENGAEAGYSAILALEELASDGPEADRQVWRDHKTASSISFADFYPNDPRAANVLAQGAQALLAKGENVQAVSAATRLTQWNPAVEPEVLQTAWLIVGQGQFDLEVYAESEYAYRQVLAMMPQGQEVAGDGPSRADVIDRIAASMFKQAEQSLASGDKGAAVDQLLSVSAIAPNTEIAISAEYDAATYLMDLERWQEAERVLVAFRQNYPNNPFVNTIPAKLVVIYQALEQWQAAASELNVMAANDADPDVRRQSLYLSAELFEQSGNVNNAIVAYRDYANNYPIPFSESLEASNKLVELYEETGDMEKRSFWLNKLIERDANAGPDRSERSKYLAAGAAAEFADSIYQNFARIQLTLPLKQSLDRKRAALDQTLKAYENILDYGVAEFTTEASFRIGAIYSNLSQDLMDSERPAGLDVLALEQYQILLEEQAFPFEEKAIEIHAANAQRSWDGIYDEWVKQSFSTLARLLPARYGKKEQVADYSDAIQ